MTRILVPPHMEKPRPACREIRLQFKLIGAEVRRKSAGLGPLRALVFHPCDGWQGQRWARPLGSGIFEVTLPTPGSGSCCLFLASAKPGSDQAILPCLIFGNLHSGKDRMFEAMGTSPNRRFGRKVVDTLTPTARERRVAS